MSAIGTLDFIDLFKQPDGPSWNDMIAATSGSTKLHQENPQEHKQMTALFLEKVFKETDERAVLEALLALCVRHFEWNHRVIQYCTESPNGTAQQAFLEKLLSPPMPRVTVSTETNVLVSADGFEALPTTAISFENLFPLIEQGNVADFREALEKIPGDIPEQTMWSLIKAAGTANPNAEIFDILIDRFGERQDVRGEFQSLLEKEDLNEGIRMLLQVALAPGEELPPPNDWQRLQNNLRQAPAATLPNLLRFLEAGNAVPDDQLQNVWPLIITYSPDVETINQFIPFLNTALCEKCSDANFLNAAFSASLRLINDNFGQQAQGSAIQVGLGFMWLREFCNHAYFGGLSNPIVQVMMQYKNLPIICVQDVLKAVKQQNPDFVLEPSLADQLQNYCRQFQKNSEWAPLNSALEALCPPPQADEISPPPANGIIDPPPANKQLRIEDIVEEACREGDPGRVSALRQEEGAWIINPWWVFMWLRAWWNQRPQERPQE